MDRITKEMEIEPMAVPLHRTEFGTLRVGDTRVSLDTVILAYRQGQFPEQIVEDFQTLDLGQVYAVIAYYLAHREQVDAYMEDQRIAAEKLRNEIESQPDYQERKQKLLNRASELGLR